MPPRWLDEKIQFLTPIRLGYHKNVVFNHLCSEFELPCALLPSIKAVHKRSRQLVCYSVRSSSYQKEFIAAGFVLSGDSYIRLIPTIHSKRCPIVSLSWLNKISHIGVPGLAFDLRITFLAHRYAKPPHQQLAISTDTSKFPPELVVADEPVFL